MKLTDAEWSVLNALWANERLSLKELTEKLKPIQNWSNKTVFTYLTRMEAKGLISIDRTHTRPYSAAVSREDCARWERTELCAKVYNGAAGDMIAAFIKESAISQKEIQRLKQLLTDMEV